LSGLHFREFTSGDYIPSQVFIAVLMDFSCTGSERGREYQQVLRRPDVAGAGQAGRHAELRHVTLPLQLNCYVIAA